MQLEKYEVRTSKAANRYEFVSSGRNGDITKVIEFVSLDQRGSFYSLGFGDVDPETGEWNDKAVTNNGDRNKILATVAAVVVYFLEEHPRAAVYAEGSTLIRNRLYQRTIERFWEEISDEYEVIGYNELGRWVDFERDTPLNAFIVRRK